MIVIAPILWFIVPLILSALLRSRGMAMQTIPAVLVMVYVAFLCAGLLYYAAYRSGDGAMVLSLHVTSFAAILLLPVAVGFLFIGHAAPGRPGYVAFALFWLLHLMLALMVLPPMVVQPTAAVPDPFDTILLLERYAWYLFLTLSAAFGLALILSVIRYARSGWNH